MTSSEKSAVIQQNASYSAPPSNSVSHQSHSLLWGWRLRKINENMTEPAWAKTAQKQPVSMLSQPSVVLCLWVGVTWQWAGWWQWLVYHLSPAEPARPYAQTEGGWATELWSCGQLLGPNCRTIWRWIMWLLKAALDSHCMSQWPATEQESTTCPWQFLLQDFHIFRIRHIKPNVLWQVQNTIKVLLSNMTLVAAWPVRWEETHLLNSFSLSSCTGIKRNSNKTHSCLCLVIWESGVEGNWGDKEASGELGTVK